MIYATLRTLEKQILDKYEAALDELGEIRYVYDSAERKNFLSGKLEAYEDVTLMIKALMAFWKE